MKTSWKVAMVFSVLVVAVGMTLGMTLTAQAAGTPLAAQTAGAPMTAQAADPVSYIECGWDGSKVTKTPKTVSDYTQITADTTTLENGKWYVVSGSVTVSERIRRDENSGTVNLILCDGATLTAEKGIWLPNNAKLNIYAQEQGTGKLTAKGVFNNAGIGGGDAANNSGISGTLTIHGGTIMATGGERGAGIGGGWLYGCGPVTIYDGTVTAVGSSYATAGAGIGGGFNGDGHNGRGSTITIYGGKVTATGGQGDRGAGAGIGGGQGGAGGNVFIYGGEVTATGGQSTEGSGAGIGGGSGRGGGDVFIYGGVVDANGGAFEGEVKAKGIGAGSGGTNQKDLTIGPQIRLFGDDDRAPAATVRHRVTDEASTYSGERYLHMKVAYVEPVSYLEWDSTSKQLVEKTASDYSLVDEGTSEFKDDWYVVKGRVTNNNRITVTGDARVILLDNAKMFTNNGGIGVSEGNSLNIYAQSTNKSTMGYLYAEGSGDGAAIGGNRGSNGGEITIHGGSYYLLGYGGSGAAIGGGSGGSGGTIIIYSGDIDAIGGSGGGAGIGGGNGGSGGRIEIYGGEHSVEGRAGAAGIGGGLNGDGGWIGIYGGKVLSVGDNAYADNNKYGMGIGQGYGSNDNGHLEVGSGLYVYGGSGPNPSTSILPDDEEYARQQYMVVNNRVPPHGHVFSYGVEGAVITATCIGPRSCPQHYDEGITLTIRAEGGTYDGMTSFKASLEGLENFESITGQTASEEQIEYYGGSVKLDSAPVNAGTYTAKITVKGKTASVDFTVDPLPSEVTVAPTANELGFTGQPQPLVAAGEALNGTMQYALGNVDGALAAFSDSVPTGTGVGTYYVWYKAKGDVNYKDTEPSCVTVAIEPVKHTVTFVDEDSTVLKEATEYAFGTPAADIAKPADPEKPADEQYTYTFAGWTPEIADVTADATYTATYSSTTKKYTVTFEDADGTVLKEATEYAFGTPAADIVMPADPEKPANAQYTYTFERWDPPIADVTGDVTYTAAYSSATNKYRVTWRDENGRVIETDPEVPYGDTPSYDQPTPRKAQTKEYEYSFAGWSPEVSAVAGDAVYTATYTAEPREYTLFYRYDEEGLLPAGAPVLPEAQKYHYGQPITAADVPSMEGYTFSGWENEPRVMPAVDVTAVGTWIPDDGTPYRVEHWLQNLDGSGYEPGITDKLEGTTDSEVVAKERTFDGFVFDETVAGTVRSGTVAADGSLVLKLFYTRSAYEIKFVDEDGTVLKGATEYDYGTQAADIVKPADPTKPADAQYTYAFSGWFPELADVTEAATYTATYSSATNKYKVTFVDEDGTVLKEATEYAFGTPAADIAKPADPEKPADEQYTYTFAGWTPEIADVTADATYTATYSSTTKKYTVTFEDADGTVLKEATEYAFGTPAAEIAKPADPAKPADEQHTYAFTGWDPEVADVTGDATYTAAYSQTTNRYKVTFVDEDGTVLKEATEYDYGTSAAEIAKPADPAKPADEQHTYAFSGWDPEVADVTGDATYTAAYSQTTNRYKVTFVDEDGTVLKGAAEYDYGTPVKDIAMPDNPTKQADAQYTYAFSGWDPKLVKVTGDATYTATYSSTTNRYKVAFVDEDGETVLKEAVEYDYGTSAAEIVKPADPTKAADAQHTYAFTGWDPEVADVTGDAVYKAVYTATAIPEPAPAPGSDPNQMGVDGTPVGPGASAAAADRAITSLASDTDPAGSVFLPLRLKGKKQTKKSITIGWTKAGGAAKYVIYGNRCGKAYKMKKLATAAGKSKTFKKVAGAKLKKGTSYKFIVVALDKDDNVVCTSKMIHVCTKGGKLTNHKSVKVQAKAGKRFKAAKKVSVRAGKTARVRGVGVKAAKRLKYKAHTKMRYESSNAAVATVSAKGVVKGVGKGTCRVWAYSQNGVGKSIKVVVK